MNRVSLNRASQALGMVGLCGALACSTPSSNPTGGGGQDLGTPAQESPDLSPKPQPSPDLAQPVSSLPFVVDSAFVTSGYMGDGATTGVVSVTPAGPGGSTDCDGQRQSSTATGSCHTVVYTPLASGGEGWAGVYWQYPANNWGTKPGYQIPAGATKVTFLAKGAAGGEKVQFIAGGIINAGSAYTDSVKATATVTLTNTWETYTIDLAGQLYSGGVIGAFAWTMAGTDAGTSATFYIDSIEWE